MSVISDLWGGGEKHMPGLGDRRAQLVLLLRTIEREAHILMREPEVLPSHVSTVGDFGGTGGHSRERSQHP
jgi:hypothetical protein